MSFYSDGYIYIPVKSYILCQVFPDTVACVILQRLVNTVNLVFVVVEICCIGQFALCDIYCVIICCTLQSHKYIVIIIYLCKLFFCKLYFCYSSCVYPAFLAVAAYAVKELVFAAVHIVQNYFSGIFTVKGECCHRLCISQQIICHCFSIVWL